MAVLLDTQTKAIIKLLPFKVGALFMEPGTGKTRIACELVNSAESGAVFWFGPINTLRPNAELPSIVDEVNRWGGFNVPVYYIGIESISASDRIFLATRAQLMDAHNPFIIIDESIKVKNIDAKRTKRIIDLSQFADYKLILNGTPISRNILDIWAQMEFLSPLILGMKYSTFRDTFCKYTTITKKLNGQRVFTKEFITGYENIDYLYSLIRHYVFECDLSLRVSQLYTELNYNVDQESLAEYDRIKEVYLSDETLEWRNNNIFLEMTQKMQHAYCCTQSKFDILVELFKEIPQSRTIIFCKYIDSRNACQKMFPSATVLSYQREALGLNLQHLNNTVYFDKIWDYALRLQSGRRTFRTGQEYDCRYWDLTGNVGLERLIDCNIERKIKITEYFKSTARSQIYREL